jgi:hypothetical protein
MTRVITLATPDEHWKYQPESHVIEYDELGWAVRRVGGNCSQVITEDEARATLESWRQAFDDGWVVAQPCFAPDKEHEARHLLIAHLESTL